MSVFPLDFDADLHARLEWTLRVDNLKRETRQNPLLVGAEREQVAAHCWHLAMSAIIWAPATRLTIDVDKAVRLAVVHDFPELFTGDHSVYSDKEAQRSKNEEEAMEQFARQAPTDFSIPVWTSWQQFEAKEGPEARFVMALDAALPILLNHANIEQSSWLVGQHIVHPDQVRRRVDEWIQPVLPDLATVALALITDATERGAFSRAL